MTIKVTAQHLIIAICSIVVLAIILIGIPYYRKAQEAKQVDIITRTLTTQGAVLLNSHKVQNVYLIDWVKDKQSGSAVYLDGIIILVNPPSQPSPQLPGKEQP